jgi:hypothetical protein
MMSDLDMMARRKRAADSNQGKAAGASSGFIGGREGRKGFVPEFPLFSGL